MLVVFAAHVPFFVHIASKTTSQQSIYLHFTNGLYLNAFTLVAFAAHVPFAASIYLHFTNGLYLNAFMLVVFAAHVPFLYE